MVSTSAKDLPSPESPLCRVQPGAWREQQCCSHLHGFVLHEYSATHGLQGPQSFQRERCSPSPLSFWPFSVSLQAFFSIKCIRDPHLVAGGTAQRPFRTGQDRTGVSAAHLYWGCGREAGGVTVLSVTRAGHLRGSVGCDTDILALVSSTVGVHAGSPG